MALEIRGLCKTYPNGVRALGGISLRAPHGVFGLLGENGAGKSTLMRVLATLLRPDGGSVFLGGRDWLADVPASRRRLGYLPQEFGVYPRTRAEDMLEHIAALKGIAPRSERRRVVEALLRQVNLHDVRHRRMDGFSGGMKRRFGIAQALIGEPALVIVDEPTAGLDPAERNRFYNLLSEIGESAVVLLATHIVEDVRSLCRELAIIGGGRILAAGTPEALIDACRGRIWTRRARKDELPELRAKLDLISTHLLRGQHFVQVYSDSRPHPDFEPRKPTLEDAYFAVTRRSGRRARIAM